MLQYNEINFIEIDRKVAFEKYNCKKRMRLYSAKGMLMATIDLATGKIFGCEEGSRVYFHELGHKAFSEMELGARISYYQIFFMMLAVFCVSLSLLIGSSFIRIFAFVLAVAMIVCYIIEEVYCWWWGLRQWKLSQKKLLL